MAFYIFPKALSSNDCDKYLKYCLRNTDWHDASTIVSGFSDNYEDTDSICEEEMKERSQYNYETRKTDVSFITDKDNLMNELVWGYIRKANEEFFNYNLNYFQAIQFARYQNGGHYDWHQDASGKLENTNDVRKLSLTMSLTDHTTYEGGLLEFFNGEKPLEDGKHNISEDVKAQGSVIVFDSYDWHRVTPVTKGVRYSVVCWTVGPHFV